MSSSFQSTAFRSSASPVDTFVEPVRVQPKTGIEELASALATVNPALQKIIGAKMKQAAILDEQRGQEIILNAGEEKLKSIVAAIQKKDGNEAARQIIGSSMFVRRGIEKQLAINLGHTVSSNTQAFFNNYNVETELEDGSIQKVPLSHYSINSPEFKNAVADYQINSKKNLKGIRSLYVNEFFLPKQSKALNKVYLNQIKKNNEYNVQKYEGGLRNTILVNFNNIDEIGSETALSNIQSNITELEKLNLTKVVSPKELIKTINDQAYNIFIKYEDDGFETATEYLDFVGDLKVGSKQILKNGTVKQSLLKDFYGKDTVNLVTDLITANEKINKQNLSRYIEVEKNTIREMIKRHSFVQIDPDTKEKNYEVVQALIKAFPDRFEFIEDLIEEQDFSRDEFYTKFKFDLIKNKYTFDQAFNVLKNFETSLGVSITKEDEIELEKLFTLAKELEGKDVLSDYRNEINNTKNEGKRILGGEGEFYNMFPKDFYTKQQHLDYIDAESKFNKKILEIFSKTELKPEYKTLTEQHATEFKKARIEFLADVTEINERKDYDSVYKRSGIISEVEKEIKKRKKERGEGIKKDGKESDKNKITFESIQEKDKDKKNFSDLISKDKDTENTSKPTKQDLESNLIGVDQDIIDLLIDNDKYEKTIINKQEVYRHKETDKLYILRDNYDKVFEGLEPGFFTDDSPTTVTVKKGDTLFGISQLYNTTVEKIKEVNGLTSDVIRTGQELIMPTITRLVNTVGDAVVSKEDLKNRSVLEEIDITKPFSYDSLYRLAMEVGFTAEQARIMAAIALAESGGIAGIDTVQSGLDPEKKGEFSLGLWQIDMQDTPGYMVGEERRPKFKIKSNQELYNPLTNAKAAKIIFEEQGFEAWTQYRNGEYKNFLPKSK